MSKGKARVFVPLTKVDEEQRLVYGVISQQVLDKSGEMMDYAKSKDNFKKWSDDIHEASGGLSKGNLRVMHGLSVAGKVTEIEFNDEDQSIEVCAKVVDDAEWNKVTEGCYTGFSVGGKYGKKWNEVVDGATIKKYEAIPNEVSLVDNPCCPSATFSLVKADGAEENVMFKAAQEVSEEAPGTGETPAQADEPSDEPKTKEPDPQPTPGSVEKTVTNEQVAARATELAKAAGEDKVWTDFIEQAREELTKADSPLSVAAAQEAESREAPSPDEGEEGEDQSAAEGADEADPDVNDSADAGAVAKTTPAGVKQTWQASDGKTFDKKADAVAHEEELQKAAEPAVEPTEADLLAARLEKALNPEDEVEEQQELPLIEDFDRLGKAVAAICTPFENGEPKLEKGMYTINRFSNVLSDMASLSRSIKAEGKREGDDASDSTVSADIIAAVKTLGTSFIAYATNQVTELLAGMDDDVVVSYHDYYYNAVQNDPNDGLAKDVVGLINEFREPSREKREDLVKAFGITDNDSGHDLDELSPPMQKRFDDMAADNEKLKKIAASAVEKVEEFAERLKKVEDTPMPRAPNGNVALKEGDSTFLGKAATNEEERMAILQDMLKTHGADGMATLMIKAAQQNGQTLSLKS